MAHDSFLGNAIDRRSRLNKQRRKLTDLGARGLPQPQRSTPPVVPADRPNPQQQSVNQALAPTPAPAVTRPTAPAPASVPSPAPSETPRSIEQRSKEMEKLQFTPEERAQMMQQITPFLENLRNQRRVQAVKGVVMGRSRRFLGGGI